MPDTYDPFTADSIPTAANSAHWLVVTPLNGVQPLGQEGWRAPDRPDPDLLDAALFGAMGGGPDAIDPNDRTFAILDAAAYDFLPDCPPHRPNSAHVARE